METSSVRRSKEEMEGSRDLYSCFRSEIILHSIDNPFWRAHSTAARPA